MYLVVIGSASEPKPCRENRYYVSDLLEMPLLAPSKIDQIEPCSS